MHGPSLYTVKLRREKLLLAQKVYVYVPFSEGRKWGVRSVMVEFGVFGAPRFSVQRSKNPLKIGIWGPLDLKIGAPQKRQMLPRQIWPPICGPLIFLAWTLDGSSQPWSGSRRSSEHRKSLRDTLGYPSDFLCSSPASGPEKGSLRKGSFQWRNF